MEKTGKQVLVRVSKLLEGLNHPNDLEYIEAVREALCEEIDVLRVAVDRLVGNEVDQAEDAWEAKKLKKGKS